MQNKYWKKLNNLDIQSMRQQKLKKLNTTAQQNKKKPTDFSSQMLKSKINPKQYKTEAKPRVIETQIHIETSSQIQCTNTNKKQELSTNEVDEN